MTRCWAEIRTHHLSSISYHRKKVTLQIIDNLVLSRIPKQNKLLMSCRDKNHYMIYFYKSIQFYFHLENKTFLFVLYIVTSLLWNLIISIFALNLIPRRYSSHTQTPTAIPTHTHPHPPTPTHTPIHTNLHPLTHTNTDIIYFVCINGILLHSCPCFFVNFF